MRAVRERCWAQGFMEVETPILNAIPSGSARPFATRHNALDSDFYLAHRARTVAEATHRGRVRTGLRVGRVFRNEGVSPRHNPEFTMLEIYAAYWNYEDMMTFTEELAAGVAMDVLGTTEVEYQGRPFSFAAPWPRRTMAELASEAVGEDVSVHTPREELARCSREHGVEVHAPGARDAVWPSSSRQL